MWVVGWCEGGMYLSHRGNQLLLAYSWARPAILVAGKGRGGMFLFCLFTFIPVPLSSLSLSFISSSLLSVFSLLGDDTKWPTRVDMSLNPSQSNPGLESFRLGSNGLFHVLIPPAGFTTPTVGPRCATHLSCHEQASLDVVPDILSGSISYSCRRTQDLEMIACLRVAGLGGSPFPWFKKGSCQFLVK